MQISRKSLVIAMMFGLLLLMVFAVGPASAADPQPCKVGEPLCVKKVAETTTTRTWEWQVLKSGDQSEVTLNPGESATVYYTVTASATANDTWSASGGITAIRNQSAVSQTITKIEDILSNGQVVTLNCQLGGNPLVLPRVLAPGATLGSGQPTNPLCTYTATGTGPAPTANSVTVYMRNAAGAEVVGATRTVSSPVVKSNVINQCVTVDDDKYGPLFGGFPICANGQTTFTANYSLSIGPYDTCGEYEYTNTASFYLLGNGNAPNGNSSSFTVKVHVPCPGGCTLTQGYWKNHTSDPAWYLVDFDHDGTMEGPDETFFYSGMTYLQVMQASSAGGNAYFILGQQYIAARLNIANGASTTPEVAAAMAGALAYYHDAANTGDPAPVDPVRAQLIGWSETLDSYNMGEIGPGHCDES